MCHLVEQEHVSSCCRSVSSLQSGIVLSDWWLSDWYVHGSTVAASWFRSQLSTLCRAICSQRDATGQLESNSSISGTCHLSTEERIIIYVGVCVAAVVLSFARSLLFYFICVNASRVLHNRMLSRIFRAPVRFFDSNPIGTWLGSVTWLIFTIHLSILDVHRPYTEQVLQRCWLSR